MIKKLVLSIIIVVSCLSVYTYGAYNTSSDSDWTIIPKSSQDKAAEVIEKVGDGVGKVWTNYNTQAKKLAKKNDVGTAFASGVFNWDIILSYLKYLAQLLSGIGLVIGAGMIIYAGYKYASGVFTGDASKGGKDAVKGAIYGVLIIIFSFAIMKILLGMFW